MMTLRSCFIGKHRIIANEMSNIIFAKQMHHIAAGDASFEDIQGLRLDLFAIVCNNVIKKVVV